MKHLNKVTYSDAEAIYKIMNCDPSKMDKILIPKAICGVYFLFNEVDELVYIGMSQDIESRVVIHKKKGKDFVKYSFIEIEDDHERSLTERLLINKYLPELNNDSLTKKLKDEV